MATQKQNSLTLSLSQFSEKERDSITININIKPLTVSENNKSDTVTLSHALYKKLSLNESQRHTLSHPLAFVISNMFKI